MLAVHLENLLFLLLLVVAGLFQLLGRAARKGSPGEAKPTPKPAPRLPKPIPRAPVESDEERIRKFLEALGHPPLALGGARDPDHLEKLGDEPRAVDHAQTRSKSRQAFVER